MARSVWWSERYPPDIHYPSRQMGKELLQLKALFNTVEPTIYTAKNRRWDRDCRIVTLEKQFDQENEVWTFVFRMEPLPGEDAPNFLSARTKFIMKVVYPSGYPDRAPEVVVPSDDYPGAEHVLSLNHHVGLGIGLVLCLESHDGARTGWDPAKSTAATYALWGIQWIRAYKFMRHNDRSQMPAASST